MRLPLPAYPESVVHILFCSKNSFLSTNNRNQLCGYCCNISRSSCTSFPPFCLHMTDGIFVDAKKLGGFRSSHTAIYREESLPVGQLPAPTHCPWASNKVPSLKPFNSHENPRRKERLSTILLSSIVVTTRL